MHWHYWVKVISKQSVIRSSGWILEANGDYMPTPVAARSTAQVCSRFMAGIVGLKRAEGMDVHLCCVLCRWSLAQMSPARHCRLCVCVCVCVSVYDLATSALRRPRPDLGCLSQKKMIV